MTEQTAAQGTGVDPTPDATIAAFVVAVRAALGGHATEEQGPVAGYEWTWTMRGVWTLRVGAILDPRPHVKGPAGEWRFDAMSLHHTDLVLLMLRLAGALPAVQDVDRVALGHVYGQPEGDPRDAYPPFPGSAVDLSDVVRPDATGRVGNVTAPG